MQQAMNILENLRSQPDYQTLFDDVHGFLHVDEGCALLALAAGMRTAGEVVEIGSYHGRSTCFMAFGLRLRGQGMVTAVDHFEGSPEHQEGRGNEDAAIVRDGSTLPSFLLNLNKYGLKPHVRPVVSSSVEAADQWSGGPIRLLFIDGDHSYDGSKADFEAWTPHVANDGLVAFHDVGDSWPGVTRFFEEVTSGGGWELKLAVGSIRVVQRMGQSLH